ncbi:MAG: aminoglycoside phosphotransferase family protein [Alphaproteobacteria bacterium]|nr:aminoglycoside phosphotransferase family protein [Alphaproteobacteria bacterium]
MKNDDLAAFFERKFPGDTPRIVGSGSDSVAWRVGDNIVRCTRRNPTLYTRESAVCNYIRPFISVDIPRIETFTAGHSYCAIHPMIMGNAWSWHTFMFHPRRQRNLARSCARFLVQLHGVDVAKLCHAVPELRTGAPYIPFERVADFFARFMSRRQMRCFERHYNRIVANIPDGDMALVHLGLKGINSVVDAHGNLCGVFDFCNCGIFERWRDLVLMSLSRNRPLYREFLREYERLSGRRPDRRRIADLRAIEFMWEKRWYFDGRFCPRSDRSTKKNIAGALTHFYRWPRWTRRIIYLQLGLHDYLQRRAAE